ncbi:MAG: hypothetical protein AB1486_35130 [Planctomycetota bacterium]
MTHPCFYEPDINRTYLDMARHYNTTILPARPRKPRDKAKAEAGVLVFQREILAPLRRMTFFSVAQANAAMALRRDEVNGRKFEKMDTTRKELYETLDKPALRPLPPERYQFAAWLRARVNIDYHVAVDKHFYSVPYQLVQKEVEICATATTIEILFQGRRVASHRRSNSKYKCTTIDAHRPKSHQRYLEWTPSRIVRWAEKSGPATAQLVAQILASRPHPEQGYRSCLGLFRLGERYGAARLEAASRRALATGACSYKSVSSILARGLDQQPLEAENHNPSPPIPHDNIRGPHEYQ